jgi:hypothetical protein
MLTDGGGNGHVTLFHVGLTASNSARHSSKSFVNASVSDERIFAIWSTSTALSDSCTCIYKLCSISTTDVERRPLGSKFDEPANI